MKTINVTFEDSEFDYLLDAKGKTPWREFIINQINNQKKETGQVSKQ